MVYLLKIPFPVRGRKLYFIPHFKQPDKLKIPFPVRGRKPCHAYKHVPSFQPVIKNPVPREGTETLKIYNYKCCYKDSELKIPFPVRGRKLYDFLLPIGPI